MTTDRALPSSVTAPPVLQARGLVTEVTTDEGCLRAVDGVSFDLHAGQALAVVGESGCGKTTAGRSILRLIEPTSGQVRFDGADLLALNATELRAMRRRMRSIFQDPFASLNPRMSVGAVIAEGMTLHGIARSAPDRRERVAAPLERVGLSGEHMTR